MIDPRRDVDDYLWRVFTGDALFVSDTGRTDLPDPEKTGENAGILYDAGLRLGIAFVGGAIMAYGARLAGGCTSGHGISGALQLSVSSWIALVCFFASVVATAHLLYAETSGHLGSTIENVGNRGRIMLPDVLGIRLAVFLALFVPLLMLGLFAVTQLAP